MRSWPTAFTFPTARPCASIREPCASATATRLRTTFCTRVGQKSSCVGFVHTTRSLRLRESSNFVLSVLLSCNLTYIHRTNKHSRNSLAAAHFRNRARSRSRAKASKEEEQVLPYSSILRDEAGRNEKHGPGIFGSAVSSSSCFQIFRPCDVLPDYILRISWISEFHNSKRRRSSVRKNNHSFARNAEIVRTCIRDKIVKEIAQVC